MELPHNRPGDYVVLSIAAQTQIVSATVAQALSRAITPQIRAQGAAQVPQAPSGQTMITTPRVPQVASVGQISTQSNTILNAVKGTPINIPTRLLSAREPKPTNYSPLFTLPHLDAGTFVQNIEKKLRWFEGPPGAPRPQPIPSTNDLSTAAQLQQKGISPWTVTPMSVMPSHDTLFTLSRITPPKQMAFGELSPKAFNQWDNHIDAGLKDIAVKTTKEVAKGYGYEPDTNPKGIGPSIATYRRG